MARKSFLYYLFSKNKAPLYVDENNHVQEGDPGNYTKPNGQPARLQMSPDGWKDTLVKYARNLKYWGLFRDFTVPMRFVGDGAKILHNRMWSAGVEAITYMGIAKLDRTTLPYKYTNWYISELYFTKYKQTRTGVEIQAVEGGLVKYIKANENTAYEIPITTDLEKRFLEHDGVVLTNKSNYLFIDQLEIKNSEYGGFHWLPFMFNNKEATAAGLTFQTQSLEDINLIPYADKLQSTNWFARADTLNTDVITAKIQGRIAIKCTRQDAANGLKLRFLRSNQDIANQNDYEVFSQTPLVGGEVYYQDVNINIPLQPGERLYFEGFLGTTGVNTDYQFLGESHLSITYDGRGRKSYIEFLTPERVLEKLLSALTGNQYQAQSNFITARTDVAITSGNAIRGIKDYLNPNKITTSLSDFFKAFGIYSIGLTVKDDKLIIEPLADFFKSSIIADLGEVDDVVIEPAEDMMFNRIRCGGEEIEYNDVNGKLEPNQGQTWEPPTKKVVKDLDIKNPYRTDPIGIELLRINYEGLTTTDTKDDGKPFMINIKTVSEVITQTVDFFSSGVYMTNPGNYEIAPGSTIRITGSTGNNNDYLVVATGTNIIQFDPAGPPVVDETGANITITFLTGGVFKLNRPAYTALSGIPTQMQSSIYNLEFSPKTSILNNGRLIRSILDMMDAELIKRTQADKNGDLSRTIGGVTIDEKADIQIGSLGDRLFLPYYITLRTKVPVNVIELINANPYGKIQFTYNGTVFYMFLMDGGIAPAKAGKDNDAQTWKGIAATENDMKKFEIN